MSDEMQRQADAFRALLTKLLNPPSGGYQADYCELDGQRLRIDADYDLTEEEARLARELYREEA